MAVAAGEAVMVLLVKQGQQQNLVTAAQDLLQRLIQLHVLLLVVVLGAFILATLLELRLMVAVE